MFSVKEDVSGRELNIYSLNKLKDNDIEDITNYVAEMIINGVPENNNAESIVMNHQKSFIMIVFMGKNKTMVLAESDYTHSDDIESIFDHQLFLRKHNYDKGIDHYGLRHLDDIKQIVEENILQGKLKQEYARDIYTCYERIIKDNITEMEKVKNLLKIFVDQRGKYMKEFKNKEKFFFLGNDFATEDVKTAFWNYQDKIDEQDSKKTELKKQMIEIMKECPLIFLHMRFIMLTYLEEALGNGENKEILQKQIDDWEKEPKGKSKVFEFTFSHTRTPQEPEKEKEALAENKEDHQRQTDDWNAQLNAESQEVNFLFSHKRTPKESEEKNRSKKPLPLPYSVEYKMKIKIPYFEILNIHRVKTYT